MSDDEGIQYVKRQKTIHYGSLEVSESQKLLKSEGTNGDVPETVKESQIHTSSEYFDLEHEM